MTSQSIQRLRPTQCWSKVQYPDLVDNLHGTGNTRDYIQKVLHWLSPVPYEEHHQNSRSDVLRGTGW